MKTIVSVQFPSKVDPETFSGKKYNYYAEIDLGVGDLVVVPTWNGESIAQVAEIDVPESQVDERWLPDLKTIEKRYDKENTNEGVTVNG